MEIVKDKPAIEDIKEITSYDPNKKYEWKAEDAFVLSGNEFGVILNALRGVLASPEAQRILLADRANDIIENVMARSVENGIVKEVKQ